MNVLTHWIETPAARALGWTLFHFLWEGIAIAAALALVLLLVKPARARYIAACIALAATLAVSVGTFIRVLPQQARHVPVSQKVQPRPALDGNSATAKAAASWHAEDVLPWAAPVWLAAVLLLHLRTIARWIAARRLCRSGVCA